jgi:hypothetical protein
MVKMPGQSPHKKKFQRKLQPKGKPAETESKAVRRQAAKKPVSALRVLKAILRTLLRVLIALPGRISKKKLPSENAVRAQHGNVSGRRLRVLVGSGCIVLVTALLMLILLAPGSAAEPASDTLTALQSVAASPVPTPIPTTEPDVSVNPIPTTEPDASQTPTPKPTKKPTATPKPTEKPTATSKPTEKPTEAPQPASTSAPPVAVVPATMPSPGGTDMASLVSCFAVSADTYYDSVGYSSNHYDYTDEELLVLARIMQIEAGSSKGMIAVGNVIMNRVLCGRFGGSITAVVTAKNQFAYKESLTPKQSAIDAAHAVLDNEVWLVPQNTYFFKGSGTEGVAWGSNPYCATIGGNYFYTHNYSNRYNNGGVPPALFDRVYQYAQYGCQSGERVARIQYMLQTLGYNVSPDGCFGKGTKEALAAFQQSAGLTSDGVAGPASVEALINAIGIDNYIAKYYS